MIINELETVIYSASDLKTQYEAEMDKIAFLLRSMSPKDNRWYFNGKGFFSVDVDYDYCDEYLTFVESLVESKYICEETLSGLSIMLSLTTLKDCLENNKK